MRCVNCRQETCILVGTCFHCGNKVNILDPYYISKSQTLVTNTDNGMYTRTRANIGKVK